MIEKAIVEITVDTDKHSVKMEIANPPQITEQTIKEFAQNHPAFAIAQTMIHKINQELKNGDEKLEKEK